MSGEATPLLLTDCIDGPSLLALYVYEFDNLYVEYLT
jgi:hypothetical protein